MSRTYYALFAAMWLLSACLVEGAATPMDSTATPPSPNASSPEDLPTLSFLEPPTPTIARLTPIGEETRTGFNVRGWTCGGCLVVTLARVRQLPGILEVTGDLNKGTLIVRYDSALISQGQIVEAIENLGYAVEGTFEP